MGLRIYFAHKFIYYNDASKYFFIKYKKIIILT